MAVALLYAITYSMGLVGIILNAILVRATHHTPVVLRAYATIFRASAYVDCAALLTMMVTTTREVIFNGSCIMEFYGVCALIGDRFCWMGVGIQVYLYSTTYTLLCLSFAFRLYALGNALQEQRVIWLIFGAFLLNLHEIPTYFYSLFIGWTSFRPFIDNYKQQRMITATRLSVVYFPDLFSLITLSLSMFIALIYFLIIVAIRSRTMTRFHQFKDTMSSPTHANEKMLNDALNVQLAASSFWFIGGTLFTINVIFEGSSPEFAHYTPSIINLQNISTPLTNLYIITPYRKYITNFVRRLLKRTPFLQTRVTTISSSTSMHL